MKLDLKSIKINKGFSEETVAYSANLYVNGKAVASVSNRGTGGCDDVYPLSNSKDYVGVMNDVYNYFKSLPKIKSSFEVEGKPFEYHQTLETWCHDIVYKRDAMLDYMKAKKTKIMFVDEFVGDGVYEFKKGKHKMESWVRWFKENRPNSIMLNTMDNDEALKLFAPQLFA